jgi:hypothetical protein
MADEPLLLNERTSSPIDMLLAGARILTLITGVVLILVGVVYGIQVFLTVGSLLKNPAGLEAPVKAMEKVISAENLALNINGQAIQVGGAVALLLMFLWYVFWAWIPLAIIAAGGKLVGVASQLREARNGRPGVGGR